MSVRARAVVPLVRVIDCDRRLTAGRVRGKCYRLVPFGVTGFKKGAPNRSLLSIRVSFVQNALPLPLPPRPAGPRLALTSRSATASVGTINVDVAHAIISCCAFRND